MTSEEIQYRDELQKLRNLAAKRDFSSQGDAEYAAQLVSVRSALLRTVKAEMKADEIRKSVKPKKVKGM